MNDSSKFGRLIGVIYINETHCSFMIYSTKNAELLTFHELKLKQMVCNPGWLEYDAMDIWKQTVECIEIVYKNLDILEISQHDIISIAVCTMRGFTLLWDKETGIPLHNGLGWTDSRSIGEFKGILRKVNYNVNHLRSVNGLPLSTCFCAVKLKWLMENVPAAEECYSKNTLAFGTLDSWIIWNLTGSTECGNHVTDITNAQHTGLINIHNLDWDKHLCNFYYLPSGILPQISSNSDLFGYIVGGVLDGLPICASICEESAALLGQLSIEVGDNVCSIGDGCCVILNTGNEFIHSDNGLCSIVAYKLGSDEHVCRGVEGIISNSGSAVSWLKEKLGINNDIDSKDNVVDTITTYLGESSVISSSCSSSMLNFDCSWSSKRSELTFVPAFNGLYSPYWRYDAKGMLLGLSSHTSAENVTQAAYEATGFQIHEILEAFKSDTPLWDWKNRKDTLIVSGSFAENNNFLQFIADVLGVLLERPQTTSPSGLGAMIAAGITCNILDLKYAKSMYRPPSDAFTPTTTLNRRCLLYKRWKYAVRKCLNWNNYETLEEDLALFAQREIDPNYTIRRSLPGSIFFTTAFVFLILSRLK